MNKSLHSPVAPAKQSVAQRVDINGPQSANTKVRAGQTEALSNGRLAADTQQVLRFLNIVFKRCSDRHGWIVLRAFEHKTDKPILNEWISFDRRLPSAAVAAATKIAKQSGDHRAVFAPPVCVFKEQINAKTANVAFCPAIAVELDEKPSDGLAKLEGIIGPASLVIASGGIWRAPTGAEQDKLHAYWRLTVPASGEEIGMLFRARQAAALIAGGDPTAAPVVHPMRWPGSWHTKGSKPRLCRILRADDAREIDLQEALAKLEATNPQSVAVPAQLGDDRRANGFKTKMPWPEKALLKAAETLPNEDLPWESWNHILMTFYDASHGNGDGLEAAHAWSEKSDKYDPEITDARWEHFGSSPPERLSDRSLLHDLRRIDSGFPDPCELRPADWFQPIEGKAAEDVDDALALLAASNSAADDKWPEPIDLFGDDSPLELGTPPPGSLPDIIERWSNSEARRKGVSPAFAAVAAVTVCGAAIGGSLRIRPRLNDDGWTEPAGLWVTIVADPGRAKSPTINAAVKPLLDLDAERWRANKPLHEAWAARARKKGPNAPDPGAEPHAKRCIVDNATLEEQIRIHAGNPRGLLRAPDELVALLESLGAYKNSSGGDRSHMLRLFDGGSIITDRVKSGSTRADSALMSVLAGTQPEKIAKLTRDLSDDGMLQRFIFIVDDGQDRKGVDEAPDHAASRDYARLVRALAEAQYLAPDPIRLSPGAYQALAAATDQIEALADIPIASSAWKGHVSKWGKILPRLALIFHAIESWSLVGYIDPAWPVSVKAANKAVLFGRFLLRHSLRFYENYCDAYERDSDARWIGGYLLTKPGLVSLKPRDLCRAQSKLADRRKLLSAMSELENAAWVDVVKRGAEGPTEWKVNPKIHVRFSQHAAREKAERARRQERIRHAAATRNATLTPDKLSAGEGR